MNRFLFVFLVVTAGYSQSNSAFYVLEYRLNVALREHEGKITGTSTVRLQPASDTIHQWSFTAPKNIEITNVSDPEGNSFSTEQHGKDNEAFQYAIHIPPTVHTVDSLTIVIEFSGMFDTSASAPLFMNDNEFVFFSHPGMSWIPSIENDSCRSASLEFIADSAFTLIAESDPEFVTNSNGQKIWQWNFSSAVRLKNITTLCGSKHIVEYSSRSVDSNSVISLFCSPNRVNEAFAKAQSVQLANAASFFSSLCRRNNQPFRMKFAFIGNDDIFESFVQNGHLVIEKNSPKHMAFDSSFTKRSANNALLVHLAYEFVPLTIDSTALLDEGWAGYLATRFIISTNKSATVERRERLDAMINALSFFPSSAVGNGRTGKPNETTVISNKGRYIFLMLEYLLGKPAFDNVAAALFQQFSSRPMSLKEFQQQCEQEFGSSLQWFFQQWLYRSTAPEFIVRWNSEKTPRGMYSVKLFLEQRGDLYVMPVPVVFLFGNRSVIKRIELNHYHQEAAFQFPSEPTSVELDPNYQVFRWLIDTRILAHARSSGLFRAYHKDVVTSEKEALLALQLDPANNTGTASLAYFSLAKIAVINNDLEKAKDLFLQSMQSSATDETQLYPLLSLVRFANVLEMEGKRDEAVPMYQRAIAEGRKNPLVFSPVILEAEKYLREKFISSDNLWYGLY